MAQEQQFRKIKKTRDQLHLLKSMTIYYVVNDILTDTKSGAFPLIIFALIIFLFYSNLLEPTLKKLLLLGIVDDFSLLLFT